MPLLQPGEYSVLVDTAGFKQQILPSASVVVSETVEVKIKLELDTVKSQVGTRAFTGQAQTESSALGHATNEETIGALPLANRNYTQILALSPGVAVELPDAAALSLAFCRLAHSSAGSVTRGPAKTHWAIGAFSITGKQVKVSSLMA